MICIAKSIPRRLEPSGWKTAGMMQEVHARRKRALLMQESHGKVRRVRHLIMIARLAPVVVA
jgi:hypothetical protein